MIQILLTALIAVTAENLIFVGGIGFSRVLRAARKPKTIGVYSLFVTFFSLMSILGSGIFGRALAATALSRFMRPAIYALCAAVIFVAVATALKFGLPAVYRKWGQLLAPAAMNTVVLSMPYAQRAMAMDIPNSLAYALGTGLSFFLASLLLSTVLDRCRNTDMPHAFRGLPATLIYVGILSLAFAGFHGGKLF